MNNFTLNVAGRDPIAGEYMPNGLVHLFDRGSGLQGLIRPDGSEPRGDLLQSGWRRYIAKAVAEHFGYDR